MQCLNCGYDYDKSIGYCPKCGVSYISPEEKKTKEDKKEKKLIRESYYCKYTNEEKKILLQNLKLSNAQKQQRIKQSLLASLKMLKNGVIFIIAVEILDMITRSMKTSIANSLLIIVPIVSIIYGFLCGWSKTTVQFIYAKQLAFKTKEKEIIFYLFNSIISITIGWLVLKLVKEGYYCNSSIPNFFIVCIIVVHILISVYNSLYRNLVDLFMIHPFVSIFIYIMGMVAAGIIEYSLVTVVHGILGLILLFIMILVCGFGDRCYYYDPFDIM